MSFKCSKCGECCKNLNLSDIYAELDRGDGWCKYLVDNMCSIYETRPLKCRIDECYQLYFSDEMSLEQYYAINYDICNKLQNKRRG